MKSPVFIALTFLLLSGNSRAQTVDYFFKKDRALYDTNSNALFLQLENINVLKNNEYFSDFNSGYTIIGYQVSPALVYYPNAVTKIAAGIHMLKYSGRDYFDQVLPLFTFQYSPNKYVDLVMGTLYGTVHHIIPEPAFNKDRIFENAVENGVQLFFNSRWLDFEFFLNWERFIKRGDPFKEEFFGGICSMLKIMDKSPFKLYIPVQTLFTHKGGQVDASNDPLTTVFNFNSGLCFEMHPQETFLKSYGVQANYLGYKDNSHSQHLIYPEGYGYYPKIFANTSFLNVEAGYWNAERYFAPRGESLFHSVSSVKDYSEEHRELITSKIIVHREIQKGINIGFRFESYYDRVHGNFDFSYGLHIIFNRNFFLTKLNS